MHSINCEKNENFALDWRIFVKTIYNKSITEWDDFTEFLVNYFQFYGMARVIFCDFHKIETFAPEWLKFLAIDVNLWRNSSFDFKCYLFSNLISRFFSAFVSDEIVYPNCYYLWLSYTDLPRWKLHFLTNIKHDCENNASQGPGGHLCYVWNQFQKSFHEGCSSSLGLFELYFGFFFHGCLKALFFSQGDQKGTSFLFIKRSARISFIKAWLNLIVILHSYPHVECIFRNEH